MNNNFSALFAKCQLSEPAPEQTIKKVEEEIGEKLPITYMAFLRFSNGLEGAIGEDGYIQLWKVEDLVKRNKDYQVEEFAPGFFLIGSSGGGEALGIDLRERSSTWGHFYSVPFEVLSWKEAKYLGQTIDDIVANFNAPTKLGNRKRS